MRVSILSAPLRGDVIWLAQPVGRFSGYPLRQRSLRALTQSSVELVFLLLFFHLKLCLAFCFNACRELTLVSRDLGMFAELLAIDRRIQQEGSKQVFGLPASSSLV